MGICGASEAGLGFGLDAEVVHDELAAFGGVAAHVEAQKGGNFVFVGDFDGGEAHVGADEVLEFVLVDFAEALEAGDFGAAQGRDGGVAFFFGIAVAGFLLVAHAEEGGFEDEEMAGEDDGFEEAQEEGEEKVADVETVDVGVGGHDDFLETEAGDGFLDVEGAHEVVEFFVFVHDGAVEFGDVHGFSAQGEDGLVVDVAGLGDGAGGGHAFGDEDHAVEAALALGVEMVFAVAELGNADADGFGALAGEFLDGLEFLAEGLGFFDFFDEDLGGVGIAVEEVGDDVADLGDEVGADFGVAELVFGLGFEDGVFEPYGDGADHGFADVVAVELGLGEFVDALEEAFAEGGEVGAAVGGELAVDEGEESFVEALGVGEGDFEGGGAVVEGAVDGFVADFFEDEVGEAVFGDDFSAVAGDGEAGMEAGVEAEAALDDVVEVGGLAEDFGVGGEFDEGSVGDAGAFAGEVFDEFAAGEAGAGEEAVAVGLDEEGGREGVDGLGADAVEADGELEDVVVVFGAGVDAGDAFDDLAEGDAAAEVADSDLVVLDGDFDALAEAHDEFVYGVVDDFLEEDVDAVVVLGAVADAADVHAGALADVFQGGERLDFAFVVVVGRFGHGGKTTGA